MRYPNTKFWKIHWDEWIKAELEDAVVRIAIDQAGWRYPA